MAPLKPGPKPRRPFPFLDEKSCWTCKFREIDSSLKPCSECEPLFWNVWEKRNDE